MTFGKLTLENHEYILQCSPPYYLGELKTYGSLDEFVLRTDKPLLSAEVISKLSIIIIRGMLKDGLDSRIELSAEGLNYLKQLAEQMANYYQKL